MPQKANAGLRLAVRRRWSQEILGAAEIDKEQEISFKFKHVVEC
jgi:hypothetical protein